jgi:hypothetical protein
MRQQALKGHGFIKFAGLEFFEGIGFQYSNSLKGTGFQPVRKVLIKSWALAPEG